MKTYFFFPALVLCFTALALADDRLPEPTAAQQDEALKLVKEVHKEEYAKRGIDERRDLALKLLDEAKNTKSDAVSEYVLFREARDAATQVGDIELTMTVITEFSQAFIVEPIDMKLGALQQMRAAIRTTDAQQAAGEASLALIRESLAVDKFDIAEKSAELVASFGVGAKNMSMVADGQARKLEIKNQSTAYLAMKVAEEKLKKEPNDAPSNRAMGSYMAFYKSNWDDGLPLLAKGDDAALADAAKADVASPVAVDGMVHVADQWWDLAPTHPANKMMLMNRAEFWYKLVTGNTDGLLKQKVDKRLEQIAAARDNAGSFGSTILLATRKVLPTNQEMKQLKDLVASFKTNQNNQNDLIQLQQTLMSRLTNYYQANFEQTNYNNGLPAAPATQVKVADYFALCKAESDIRKATAGTFNFGTNVYSNFQNYASSAKTKEEFAIRLLAFEKFNNAEKIEQPMNVDNISYSCMMNYYNRMRQQSPNSITRKDLADYLKNKGVKSGLDRFYKSAERFR